MILNSVVEHTKNIIAKQKEYSNIEVEKQPSRKKTHNFLQVLKS